MSSTAASCEKFLDVGRKGEQETVTYFCSAKAEFECTVHKRLAQQKETQAELKTVKTCNITTKAMWLSK